MISKEVVAMFKNAYFTFLFIIFFMFAYLYEHDYNNLIYVLIACLGMDAGVEIWNKYIKKKTN